MTSTHYVPTAAGVAIPATVKRAVIARDGMVCQRCGTSVVRATPGAYRPDEMHLDHVVPWAAGGEHTLENLIVCCGDCNLTRPRPRKVTIVRSRRGLRARVWGGVWFWPVGYEPPVTAPAWHHQFLPVAEAATAWGEPVERLVLLASRGALVCAYQPKIKVARIPAALPHSRQRRAR